MKHDASMAVPEDEHGYNDGELREDELDFVIGGLARAWSSIEEEPAGREDVVVA